MDVLNVLHPKLYSNGLSLSGTLVFLTLLKSSVFSGYARLNLVAQLLVFIPCVQIPAFITGRLSYVDIAWPTGLLTMGLLSFARALKNLFSDDGKDSDEKRKSLTSKLRPFLISLAYVFQGGRMALGAWTMFNAGHLRKEMQRYMYQRQRWAAVGIKAGTLAEVIEIQKEAFTQCLANLGPLSVPLALQSTGNAGPMNLVECAGWCLWCSSFVWEHTSDLQKAAFGQAMKKQGLRGKVCDFGFWNYTRHPNYFGEWMVWVALTLASLPSLQAYLKGKDDEEGNLDAISLKKYGLTVGLLAVPASMYLCLVHWTGATPAEFYSLKNRADYAQYIREVNCFFPGPRRVGA